MSATTRAVDPRLDEGVAWLHRIGLDVDAIDVASADASFRRYFRVTLKSAWADGALPVDAGSTLILMDAPPEQEDSEPFVAVADQLAAMQLPAPRILAADLSLGYLLLTDLGNTSLLSVLEREPALASVLYEQAGSLLHRLQMDGAVYSEQLPAYDEALLLRELALFKDWLCLHHLGLDWSDKDEQAWRQLCRRLVNNALSQPQVFVHRDYHSRNLMIDDKFSISLIDFQDAVRGPLTYDIASLLRDCYCRWPAADVRAWAVDWLSASPFAARYSETQGLRWFFLMSVQRHLKAAGIFARLGHRDGKWQYLQDVPRTLGYILELDTEFPELAWLTGLVRNRCLPGLSS